MMVASAAHFLADRDVIWTRLSATATPGSWSTAAQTHGAPVPFEAAFGRKKTEGTERECGFRSQHTFNLQDASYAEALSSAIGSTIAHQYQGMIDHATSPALRVGEG
jgi:hypothetical protein